MSDAQTIEVPQSIRKILTENRLILLGFGAQGSAEAENLRRSGIPFILMLRPGPTYDKAKQSGFDVRILEDSFLATDSVAMNLPDHIQKDIYSEFKSLQKVRRLIFAHGFNTHFGLIPVDPRGPAHILVAPKGAANGLRQLYGTPQALPAILATRTPMEAEDRAFAEAYAHAIGCHLKHLIWADFRDETECDLFSEQALLCGGVSSLLRKTYEVLIEAGYHPEAAYFETLYELKLIVDLLWQDGITGMRNRISPTARYGDITRGDRIITDDVKDRMKVVLGEIQSGQFAKEFLENHQSSEYLHLQKIQSQHALEKMGQKIRSL